MSQFDTRTLPGFQAPADDAGKALYAWGQRISSAPAPTGGVLAGLHDILVHGPAEGVAQASQDFARPIDWALEKAGVDLWDDRWLSDNLLDGVYERRSGNKYVGWAHDFTSEAARFVLEDLAFRGALRPATAAGAKALGHAPDAVRSTGTLKNLYRLARGGNGVSRSVEALKFAETATAYGLIGAVQDRDPSIAGAVGTAAEFIAYDTAFGLLGKAAGVAGRWALKHVRSTWIGRYLDTQALISSHESAAASLRSLMEMTDDEIRLAMSEGRLAKDLGEKLINSKYDPTALEYSISGPERDRVLGEMLSASAGTDIVPDAVAATMAFHDAVARLMVRVGDPVSLPDGKKVAIRSVDDYYSRLTVKGVKSVQEAVDAPRGRVQFTGEGEAIVQLFRTADASTLLHESSHIFRRVLPSISRDLATAANRWVGAKGDKWTKAQEEKWATAFEKYVAEGIAPAKNLVPIFEMAKGWLLDVYRGVVNSPLDTELSPEVKDIFDQMLGGVSRPRSREEAAKSLLDTVVGMRSQGYSVVVAFEQGAKKTLNYKHFDTTDAALDALKKDSEAILKAVDASVGNTQSYQEWVDHATKIGAAEVVPMLKSTEKSVRLVAAKIIAGKQRMIGLFEESSELIARLQELDAAGNIGPEYQLLRKQIDARLEAAERIGALTYAIQREVARGTAAGNVAIHGSRMTAEEADRVLGMLNAEDPASAALKELAESEAKANREALERGLRELETGPAPEPTSGPAAEPSIAPSQGAEGVPGAPVAEGAASGTPPSGSAPAASNGPVAGPSSTPATGGAQAAGGSARVSPARMHLYDRIRQAVNAGQPHAVTKLYSAARENRLGAVMELWTSLLLSGMKTLSANTLGNAINTVLQPIAKAADELVSLRPDPRGALDALSLYYHLVAAFADMWHATRIHGGGFEGFRAVAKTFNLETSWFDRNIEGLSGPSFRARTFGLQNRSVAGRIVNIAGKVIRFPGLRLLTTTDEVFTNLNYIAMVRFEASKMARDLVQQGTLTADQIPAFIDSAVKSAFEKGGAAATRGGSPVWASAYAYAKDVGFKTPLEFGLGGALQEMKQKHPWLSFIMPFIKTPINIFRTAARMTPGYGLVQYAVEKRRMKLTADQLARRRGEVILGTAFWGFAMYLAANGRITGGGPRNADERRLLQATGWQPYSIVVEGEDGKPHYVSIQRLEPIASALGIAADAVEIWGHASENDQLGIAWALLESFLRNTTSKTYVTGLSEFVRVMSDPSYAKAWFRRQVATTAVPAFVAQFAAASDDELHEARSIVEAIKRRVPGLSDDLPPRRNILGEPITPPGGYVPFVDVADPLHRSMLPRMLSPAALSRKSDDVVINELATLRHGIMQPPKTLDGLDLTAIQTVSGQQAYDRWIELTGEVAPGGVNLHKALKTLIESKVYQALPPAPTDPKDVFNPRLQAVMRVLGRYREVAKRKLIEETPALKEHLIGTAFNKSSKMQAAAALLERLKQ